MSEYISPARLIRAMRDCRKDHGQGNSPDHEAQKQAQEQGLLKFISWPAGYWSITEKSFNFICENEPAE